MNLKVQEILASDEIQSLDAPLGLLQGAASLPHLRGSLLSHLCGTWKILSSHRCPPHVALAGLIHSIYSTEHYTHQLFAESFRTRVQDVVGVEAERLAYLFCTIDRKSFWSDREGKKINSAVDRNSGDVIELSARERSDLFEIECANYIEQASAPDGRPQSFMAWYLALCRAGSLIYFSDIITQSNCFSESDEERAVDVYNSYLDDFGRPELISEAARLNPYSGEIILFQGLACHRGNRTVLRDRLQQSLKMFCAWGTTWDKRLTFMEWYLTTTRLLANINVVDSEEEIARLRQLILHRLENTASSGGW